MLRVPKEIFCFLYEIYRKSPSYSCQFVSMTYQGGVLYICFHIIDFIIYNLEVFLKGFFLFYFFYPYFILGTHFSHNFPLYFNYVIRKGSGAFVSSKPLEITKLFHTHTCQGKPWQAPLRQFPKIYLPFPMETALQKRGCFLFVGNRFFNPPK